MNQVKTMLVTLALFSATKATIRFSKKVENFKAPATFQFAVNLSKFDPINNQNNPIHYISDYSSVDDDSADCKLSLRITYWAGTLTEGDNHECTFLRNPNQDEIVQFEASQKTSGATITEINNKINAVKDSIIISYGAGGSERNLWIDANSVKQSVLNQLGSVNCTNITIKNSNILLLI